MTFACGGVELITTADEFEEYLQAAGLQWESMREQLNDAKLSTMLKWFDEEELLYVPVPNPGDAEITRMRQLLQEMITERDLWYSYHKEDTLRLTKARDELRAERDSLRVELESMSVRDVWFEAHNAGYGDGINRRGQNAIGNWNNSQAKRILDEKSK